MLSNRMNSSVSTNPFTGLLFPFSLTIVTLICTHSPLSAQQFNIQVQQPVIRSFGIHSAIKVPDGGTMNLGGINRSAEGRVTTGAPLLSNLPYSGPLLRNQSIGRYSSASQATVRVHVISSKELEEQVLSKARGRLSESLDWQLNGNPEVQRQADFIKRNVGRR